MPLVKPLSIDKLHAFCDPNKLPWGSSSEIKNSSKKFAHFRAISTLNLALMIKDSGYNIYLAGERDLGRTYMLTQFLSPLAKKLPDPPDLIYVYNFENHDQPILIEVPAGIGKELKSSLMQTIQNIRKEIPINFESASYEKKKNELQKNFQGIRDKFLKKMDEAAETQSFSIDMDEQGSLVLYPTIDGKRLTDDEIENLDSKKRANFKSKGDKLLQSMSDPLRELNQAEKKFKEAQKKLDKEIVKNILDKDLKPLFGKFLKSANGASEKLQNYFLSLQAHILDNFELFLPKEQSPFSFADLVSPLPSPSDSSFSRYEVNLLVDNSNTKGAPVIFDHHPTYSHLLGCVERESEMGALVTNFTLIKAGSLHKAHGGFLILHADDILSNPFAWEGLLRALRSSRLGIEDQAEGSEFAKTKGITPQSLDLKVKIILIGSEYIYETLLELENRFGKLFKMKAQMNSETERNLQNIKAWLLNISSIITEGNLLPFDREALARLVDYGTDLCKDQKKISLKFPLVREVMIEASALASLKKLEIVQKEIIEEAINGRKYRSAYIEELFFEEYDRDKIKIQTSGTGIGQVNGLSVTSTGDVEFGLPHKISCTVGVGHGGIIDLEREAELGGPIHTKAMMILKSYLVDQFAHNKPLVLTGSLCFEQSYNGIEGDSASGAELISLLSAIAKVPVKLSLAITGAVSQDGAILPVGGVNSKIEGFFNLCNHRGLTGEQGVIIPKDNVDNLMLGEKILNAVKNGSFSIYAVTHITEALELLTNMPAGKRRKDGSFAPNTLFHAVDFQLHELGWLAENSFKSRKKRVNKAKAEDKKV